MALKQQQFNIKQALIDSAQSYFRLIDKCIVHGKCTIGFVDAKYYLRPKTILANNHLDENKLIIKVVPIIELNKQ